MNPIPLEARLRAAIDGKTKPPGSLGYLEDLAVRLGLIQQRERPEITEPTILVFASDHGVAQEGVSPFPQAVTAQMVLNFLAGGAAVSVLAQTFNWNMWVVDAGVASEFEDHPKLIKEKIALGTANFAHKPAMTPEQCNQAIAVGRRLAGERFDAGCNLLALGEMGIGNTSGSALLMHLTTDHDLDACVGRGTGLDDEGLERKRKILEKALTVNGKPKDPKAILAAYGGFEHAMMVGAFLAAAQSKAAVLVDGFIVTSALLIAREIDPRVMDHCIFAHCSDERGHRFMLEALHARQLLNLGMRLGEASGAALALPLLKAACALINDMASFEEAGVSRS